LAILGLRREFPPGGLIEKIKLFKAKSKTPEFRGEL